MDKGINAATQERIRALCGQVSVAHDLDAEIQEELYGHMEDKLLAYLAGEEKLSSEDAFILVREHFGNPEALQDILQSVHEHGVRVSLPRRLTAALVATTAIGVPVGFLCNAAQIALGLCMARLNGVYDQHSLFVNASYWLRIAPSLISSMLLWYLLVRWQGQLNQGRQLWFARWHAHSMWVAAGAALIVPLLIPKVIVGILSSSSVPPTWLVAGFPIVVAVWLLIGSIQDSAWLWWSDRAPRTGRSLRWVFLSLLLLGIFSSFYPGVFPGVVVSYGELHSDGVYQALATGSIFGTQIHWTLIWPEESLAGMLVGQEASHNVLLVLAYRFSLSVAPVLLAYGVYLLARRIRGWTTRRHTRRQAVA